MTKKCACCDFRGKADEFNYSKETCGERICDQCWEDETLGDEMEL